MLAAAGFLFDQVVVTLWTIAADWLVPRNEVTFWITITTIEDSVFLGFAFHDLAFVALWANHADFFDDGFGIAAIREARASIELPVTP